MPPNDNGWNEWSRHVLAELERLNNCYESIKKDVSELRSENLSKLKVEIAKLKVRAGVWGVMGGAIPILIALSLWVLTK